MQIIHTDSLIIGGGLAGLRTAIGAKRRGHDVVVLSIVPPKRSHSAAAQGGMQASLGNALQGQGDNEDVHFYDTVRGSDWGADQQVARMFVNTAPKAVRELAAWGVPWNRVQRGDHISVIDGKQVTQTEADNAHGLITARNFGGTAKWRTCYVSDGTGHSMLYTMSNQAIAEDIPVHERMEAISLIHDGQRCSGAIVRNLMTGELLAYVAKATCIATGGFGRIYRATTNAVRDACADDVRAELARICERRGLHFTLEETLRAAAAPSAPAWQARWERAVATLGLPVFRMPSGAGHDAMKLHEVMPQAMLFMRGLNAGISHNPLESITHHDAELCVGAFAHLLEQLAAE